MMYTSTDDKFSLESDVPIGIVPDQSGLYVVWCRGFCTYLSLQEGSSTHIVCNMTLPLNTGTIGADERVGKVVFEFAVEAAESPQFTPQGLARRRLKAPLFN